MPGMILAIIRLVERWSRIILATGVCAALGCGDGQSARPAAPANSERRAEAIAAVFEERDAAGRLLWSLAADTVIELTPDDFRCTTLRLEIHDPAGIPSRHLPAAVGAGTLVEAASGRLRRDSVALHAEIEGGFTFTLADGWHGRGESLTWDGALLRSPTRIELTRTGARITGERAVIDPRRRRIALHRVSGAVDGLALE